MQLVRPNVSVLALQNVLDESGVIKDQYDNAHEVSHGMHMENKVSILCKRKPNKVFISLYSTVLLSLLKSFSLSLVFTE